ncbi:MAG: hypothetical protein DRQ78_11300 [Epsilonproteobacteria bacterium]|nr:MAG: hypothetical protein DRQ78_11300 [Campylobacterota bacterium]
MNSINIQLMIRIKYIMILLLGICYFVGTYMVSSNKGGDYITVKSIFAAIFMVTLHSLLWSNTAYEKFKGDGINIPYPIYQVIGISIIIFNLILEINSNIFHYIFF